MQGLAFSEDGKQLYMTRQGCVPGGNVVEISPTDGHIIRTVAPNIPCATGLATDPVSGDLFVVLSVPAGQRDQPDLPHPGPRERDADGRALRNARSRPEPDVHA